MSKTTCTKKSDASLREIADWQLSPETCNPRIELPKLQRGFVWEASKIADLWDSILRGFPIGSMMISAIDQDKPGHVASEQRYWLLDGQQRATSIAIGFYNPWGSQNKESSMWSLKSTPLLWVDLLPEPRSTEVRMFSPYLVTQSHPWGYTRDGNVIPWGQRKKACEEFKLGENYTSFDLKKCFPWQAEFPIPLCFMLEAIGAPEIGTLENAWSHLVTMCRKFLPECWMHCYGDFLTQTIPPAFESLYNRRRHLKDYRVHLNLLSRESIENDVNTDDDNSLLFVRLNTGGVVLGGEELIFSLFKSEFGEAKDAVEKCSVGFMQPSKLFGLLVRLAAACIEPSKLARSVTLREFKREIRGESELKSQLKDLIDHRVEFLMKAARNILCGSGEFVPSFCLPEVVATRAINDAPDIFLGLLYWLDKGGQVELGTTEHQRLLGCFTALSWFLPGNAKSKQNTLREWIEAAGTDVAGRLWSCECLRFLFTRNECFVPLFPPPDLLEPLLLQGTLEVQPYNYENLAASNQNPAFWESYKRLFTEPDAPDALKPRREHNLMVFLNRLRPRKAMLLYAQRNFIRAKFKEFGQWDMTLKDSNCPWDWDHIYPSAYRRWDVNKVYKDWHDSIGNLRAIGLSENRGDGCDWPSIKLANEMEQSCNGDNPSQSFITKEIWKEMKELPYDYEALKKNELALRMCAVVLKRMLSIYREWHDQFCIGQLMDEIRNVAIDHHNSEPSAEITFEPSQSPV